MKKTVLLSLVLILLLYSCKTSQTKYNAKASSFISNFISYMDHENGPKYKDMMNCIAPSYLSKNSLNIEDLKVDNYSVHGYQIESIDMSNGIAYVKIWGEGKRWIHRLELELVKEKGKLFLMPSTHSDKYIKPWKSVQTYIKE